MIMLLDQQLETESLKEILSRSEIFNVLDSEHLEFLSKKMVYKTYRKGELLVRQGEQSERNIKFVVEGSAKVFVTAESGDEVVVDYRCKGDIIGLLSIATSGSSLVSVVVVEDLVCYEL